MVFRSRTRVQFSDGGRGYYSAHRSQGYIAQWLKRLTADQEVPGSIPGGGHGSTHSLAYSAEQHYEPNHNYRSQCQSHQLTRKSVNMVAELALWIPDTTERQEDYSAVAKASTADYGGVRHKGSCSTGNSCSTEERTRPISTFQDRSQGSACDCSQVNERVRILRRGGLDCSGFGVPTLAGGPAAVQIPGRLMILHTQEQHIRLGEDQSTTDTADLKMTEDALAEDTAAFEEKTQDCLVCQTKAVEFKAYNRSLSEELKALAKAVISEKTGDAEHRDNRSVLSPRGGLAREPKGEHSIELTQLASRVHSAMHAEISNDDDLFAKVKVLINDMIARLEEKAFADAIHKATNDHRQACSRCLTFVFILQRDVLP